MMKLLLFTIALFIGGVILFSWKHRKAFSQQLQWGAWTDLVAGKITGEVARRNAIRVKAFILTLVSMAIIGGFSYYFDYGQYFRNYFGIEQSALISASLALLSVFGITVFFRILFSTKEKDFFDATFMIVAFVLSIGATLFSSFINIDVTLRKKNIKLAQDLNVAADIEMYRSNRNEYIRQTAMLDGSRGWPQTKAANLAGQRYAEEQIVRLEKKIETSKDFNYYATGYIPGFAPALPLLLVLWAVYERKRAGLYGDFKRNKQARINTGTSKNPVAVHPSMSQRKAHKDVPVLLNTDQDEAKQAAKKDLITIIENGDYIASDGAGRPRDKGVLATLPMLFRRHRLRPAGKKWLRRQAEEIVPKNGTILTVKEVERNGTGFSKNGKSNPETSTNGEFVDL